MGAERWGSPNTTADRGSRPAWTAELAALARESTDRLEGALERLVRFHVRATVSPTLWAAIDAGGALSAVMLAEFAGALEDALIQAAMIASELRGRALGLADSLGCGK